ncbi:MAG TPA: PilZ domain-containing protein [Thermodesulfobacteriota bacterium]|nr:PilZ domain-containing protein [Thermodesulfobacteriota bacterium]
MEGKKIEEKDGKLRLGIARFEKEITPEKGKEKRRHPRFLLNLPMEYYHLDSSIGHSSRCVNASEGGLLVCLHERLKAGQHLKLKIFCASGSSLLTIETTVEVIWADELLGEDGNYRHGVKFVSMAQEDLQKFRGFLDNLSPLLIR